jgi:thioesterase domain-containing protein
VNPATQDRAAGLSADRAALLDRLRAQRLVAGPGPGHQPVPMRPGRGPVKLVLVHPAGGELFCYTPLVRALAADIAVIGFAADPADLDLPVTSRLPEVAARTLRGLAEATDPGRCVLAGWSYGGAVAFEMARQHAESVRGAGGEGRGRRAVGGAAPVVLLDCVYYGDVELETETRLRRRFVYDVARLAGRDHDTVRTALKARERASAAVSGPPVVDLHDLLAAADVKLELTEAEIAARYATFRACSLSLQAYRPPAPYPGPVTLAMAGEAPGIQERWQEVSAGPFDVVRLPGDHYTLFLPPALPAVAGLIEAAVTGARRDTGTVPAHQER